MVHLDTVKTGEEADDVEISELKQQAAWYAVRFVDSGMVVGLGHGTTAVFAIRCIARRLESGELTDIQGVPCSIQVEIEARKLGIPLTTLDDKPVIDVTIDGADEVDADLNLIKGGGGALLREKVVAQASHRQVIVVDETKLSPALGTSRSLPVEVISFGWRSQQAFLQSLGASTALRRNPDGTPFRTDHGNLLLDCDFGPIDDPAHLASQLGGRAGIVEHGLFLRLATDVIVAGEKGTRHLHAHS
jgi:ribose 5-phosphate isomerase A